MAVVTKEQRRLLEKAVLDARDGAETAARKVLQSLGVDEPDAPAHLNPEQRELRRSLRAQARQLGDTEDPGKKGRYRIDHLAEKIAYDQWHRLLFARFLLENNFLISPQHGVPISFEDCRELAPELGHTDGWDVAAAFTATLLPQIFRPDDPAGRIVLAPEDRGFLRQLVADLPLDVFLADDALGWVYQFWQARRKDAVNHSEKKIGADELAAVTQLFTEDYMVLFLLHNTLGAWWTAKRKSAGQCESLNGYEFTYLRKGEDGTPSADAFDGWPCVARELRFLDPSMGSGHFLVFALPMLVAMRKQEEGLTNAEACDAVLRENLYGLELDSRCTQIAAFNLALTAWKLSGYRPLPTLNIACCGLGIHAREDEWLKLTNGDKTLAEGMQTLYGLFSQAPVLGSLIDPREVKKDLLSATFEELEPLLEKVLAKEEKRQDENVAEMGVTARGLVHAAEILTGSFHLVATNVPYLGRGKQDAVLKEFCESHHKDAKADLATCFVERCLSFCEKGGTAALVTPQNWLFLTTYKKLRQKLLVQAEWNFVARLGPKAFQTPMWDFNIVMLLLTNRKPTNAHFLAGLDVAEEKAAVAKATALLTKSPVCVRQKEQLGNPDARITLKEPTHIQLLEKYACCLAGILNGDSPKFRKFFWEFPTKPNEWVFQQSTVDNTTAYGGRQYLIYFDDTNGHLREDAKIRRKNLHDSDQRGNTIWGKQGIGISQMNSLPVTVYNGEKFDSNIAIICPYDQTLVPAVWTFCSSTEFQKAVRNIDQKLNVTNATLARVPFDVEYWQRIAAEKYPHGLPKPHSDDPTQWLFNGYPKNSDHSLQVAVSRLLGYLWPRQTGSSFTDCPALDPDGLESLADEDGIVCINVVKGEVSAAERLRSLLTAAYGQDWSAGKQAELLDQTGFAGRTLEDWFRNGFFDQHCRIFHQRPFIWQIWDGLRDGFSALMNYHKLDHAALEKLTYSYLGDWIARQRSSVEAGEEGSDIKLASALVLKNKLEKILEGEVPCDIFVRWKPLEKQPIGWQPDLNDGVRLNIRPFVLTSVFRKNPNINWNKDRGKDVPSAPWFHKFKGERINDHHVSIAEKRKGRGE